MRDACRAGLLALALLPTPLAGQEMDPLCEAVMYADEEAVAALLAKGADANTVYNGRSALGWAAQTDALGIVRRLVEAGARLDFVDGVGHTPLLRATDTRKPEVTKYLLSKGADPNAADREGRTALLAAVEDGYLEIVPLLLEAKADPNRANQDGRTPLMSAVQFRQVAAIPLLAAAGADLDAPTVLGPPLLMAISDGDVELIRAVLDGGADANVRSTYGTPALIAAIEGGASPEIVALLLAHEADVKARDQVEATALHAAVRARDTAVVRQLIASGADPNAAQNNGETPLQTARYNGAPEELVAALLAAGAKE
jgi:ankyrin repeat protein